MDAVFLCAGEKSLILLRTILKKVTIDRYLVVYDGKFHSYLLGMNYILFNKSWFCSNSFDLTSSTVIVALDWNYFIDNSITEKYNCFNLHYSYLPSYRGPLPIEYLKFMNVCLESDLNVSSLLSNPSTSIICPYINQFTYNINYLGDIKKCLGYPSISYLDQISDSANSTIIHGSPWWKIKERTECEDCSAYPICLNLICPHKELCLKELFFAKEMGLCLDINKEWEL